MAGAGSTIRGHALAALAIAFVSLNPVGATRASASDVVTIQLLSVSDWHAQLEPVDGVGGAAVLSSYFKAERGENPNTLTLTAGDAFNASPPISSFFEEEPAILAMRLMGFDADTFGNHNFDRGIAHLQRMVDLAGSPGDTTPGGPFRYIASNLRNVGDNLTGTDRMALFRVGGLKVAVIGITNEDAPELVKPGSLGTIEVTNGAEAANRAANVARTAGAQVVVVLTHNGKMFLERGVSVMPAPSGRFPQVSGLCFSYDVTRPASSRVTAVVEQAADGTCTATNVDLSAFSSYTLVTNDFLAGGGDGYPNVSSRMTTRELMYEVLAEYVRTQSPLTPTVQGRITCLDGNGPDAPNCPVAT